MNKSHDESFAKFRVTSTTSIAVDPKGNQTKLPVNALPDMLIAERSSRCHSKCSFTENKIQSQRYVQLHHYFKRSKSIETSGVFPQRLIVHRSSKHRSEQFFTKNKICRYVIFATSTSFHIQRTTRSAPVEGVRNCQRSSRCILRPILRRFAEIDARRRPARFSKRNSTPETLRNYICYNLCRNSTGIS